MPVCAKVRLCDDEYPPVVMPAGAPALENTTVCSVPPNVQVTEPFCPTTTLFGVKTSPEVVDTFA